MKPRLEKGFLSLRPPIFFYSPRNNKIFFWDSVMVSCICIRDETSHRQEASRLSSNWISPPLFSNISVIALFLLPRSYYKVYYPVHSISMVYVYWEIALQRCDERISSRCTAHFVAMKNHIFSYNWNNNYSEALSLSPDYFFNYGRVISLDMRIFFKLLLLSSFVFLRADEKSKIWPPCWTGHKAPAPKTARELTIHFLLIN